MNTNQLGEIVAQYLYCCRIEAKSPKTIAWYRQKLYYFVAFMNNRGLTTIEQIGRDDVRSFLHHLQSEVRADSNNPRKPSREDGLSPFTVAGYMRSLRAFFNWAVEEGILEDSPIRGLRLPQVPQLTMRYFSEDEMRRILNANTRKTSIGFRNYTILLMLFDTGIRASELASLQMKDLHLAEGYIKVWGKGARERIVPIGYNCRRTLSRYIRKYRPEPADPFINSVFLTRDGRPLRPDYVYKIVRQACEKAGIKGRRLGPHTCRHSFARLFLLHGGDLLTLQRILGHSSLDMVSNYINLNTKALVQQHRRFNPIDRLLDSVVF